MKIVYYPAGERKGPASDRSLLCRLCRQPPTLLPGALCLLVLALLLGGCSGGQQGKKSAPPPVKVEAARVRVAPLSHTLTAVGSLSSPEETMVTSQASGKVTELNIDQGQMVQEGQVLARLDNSVELAAVKEAEAALSNARQIYARDKRVKGTGAVSEQQLQSDRAAVAEARAQLEQARASLEHTIVRAPFTGVLGMKQVSLGSYVEPPDAIVSIRQLDPLHLDFYLPQQDADLVKREQTVYFTAAGLENRFEGRVTTVDQSVATTSRTVHVQATVANPDQRLKPGMFAQVELVLGQTPNVLFVPMQAIVPEGRARTVWVVGPQQQVKKKRVEVGRYQENWVQITSGLQPDALVVTAGTQKLYPGASVVVTPYEPISNPRLNLSGPVRQLPP